MEIVIFENRFLTVAAQNSHLRSTHFRPATFRFALFRAARVSKR
jgi:hypothetical protein